LESAEVLVVEVEEVVSVSGLAEAEAASASGLAEASVSG